MDKNDRVRLVYKNHIKGTIIDVRQKKIDMTSHSCMIKEYKVRYDRKDLLPPEMWHVADELVIINEKLPQGLKCTCGLVYARSGGKHSDWCELAGRHEK